LLNATAKSPPATTTGFEPLTDGNGKNFASLPTLAGSLSPVIVVATKLPSNTIADWALALYTLSTEAGKVMVLALAGLPMSAELPNSCLSVVSALATDGSVHGIWWWVSLSYMASPALRM
jgi:hypothetical protein